MIECRCRSCRCRCSGALRDTLGLTGTQCTGCAWRCAPDRPYQMDNRHGHGPCPFPWLPEIRHDHRSLSADSSHPIQKAWIEVDVPQCGLPPVGSDHVGLPALLAKKSNPTDPTSMKPCAAISAAAVPTRRIREAIPSRRAISRRGAYPARSSGRLNQEGLRTSTGDKASSAEVQRAARWRRSCTGFHLPDE